MPSLFALSEYALSDAPAVSFVPAALRRLAQARTADPIVFMEITARANDVTFLEDILDEPAGSFIRPLSGLPTSSFELPRTQRETRSILFSTRPWCGAPNDPFRPNERAIPRIITAGRISRSVPVDSTTARRGQRTIGDAQLANPDGALDYILRDFTLDGGTIRAWVAEPGDSSDLWALVYEAQVDRVEATRQEIRVGITTIADQLERSLQLRRYTGSGGLNGDTDVAGRLRPTAWGDIFGIDPVLISKADNIYQVHDSRVQSIDAVYEGGLPYTFTADYPSYDALALATLEAGEYATCLEYGLFRIGITLAGLVFPIRVTMQGDATGNGYVSSTGDILYRIGRNRAYLSAGSLDVDSFNALPRQRVGYYTNGSSDVSCASIYDALLGGVVATYGVGRGQKIAVRRMLPAEFSLTDVSVRGEQFFDSRVESRPYTPRTSQPYTYAPTWAPLNDDQVSTEADPAIAARLKAAYQDDQANRATTAVVPQVPQPALTTYFSEKAPAEQVAYNALDFSARNLVPINVEIGRAGLVTEIGKVFAITGSRFVADDFRGVIYQQEDDLGAVIRSRVTALG